MSGAIIPEPLAKPMIVTGTPPSSTRATAPLGKVSVVMIARAARSAASAASPSRSPPSAATIRSAVQRLADHPGRGDEDVPDRHARAPRPRRADRRLDRRAPGVAGEGVGVAGVDEDGEAARPRAAGRSAASFSSHQSTGPERVAERVKTPAIAEPAATSASITSSRPW